MSALDRPTARPSPTEDGGRVELRLVVARPGERARYALRCIVGQGPGAPPKEHEGSAAVDAEGRVLVELAETPPPPAWLTELAAALLRTAARGATASGRWPRRLTRWRRGRDEA
jgi:hypothetical protein